MLYGAGVALARSTGVPGILSDAINSRATTAAAFARAVEQADPTRPIVILSHFDADGLAAAAILTRALTAAGRDARPMIVGKGESPWDKAMRGRLSAEEPALLVVADLGTRPDPVLPGVPTVIVDHHLPTGFPEDAVTISGNGLSPEPTSALLAWWAATGLGNQGDLLWLAALGLIGDMADEGWPELVTAQGRWGKTALKDATVLVNAPRRTAAADASPALRLLLVSDGPKAITKGDGADAQALRDARAEVKEAMDMAKRVAPRVVGDVALISFSTGAQVHPLVAQQWRGRLKDKVVIAANKGYRDGWVHFAARSASGRDLVAFLAEHRPAGADGRYGNGHAQATGGALPYPIWNDFIAGLGFPEQQVFA